MSEGLGELGWNETLAAFFAAPERTGLRPARVAATHRGLFWLLGLGAPVWGVGEGRLAKQWRDPLLAPTVGDWAAVRESDGSALIVELAPRRTAFVRKASGRGGRPQALAANVDRVFVVTAVGGDLNARRLERYLAAAWASGAEPAVVVNKTDLPHDPEAVRRVLAEAATGAPQVMLSALADDDLGALRPLLAPGQTYAFIGSSGVGKSTLINRVLGAARQAVAPVRAGDERGRHATTRRELIPTGQGFAVIDTPGLREVGLWEADAGLETAFADLARLAEGCRFGDCSHENEPGCALLAAAAAGLLDPARLENYRRLRRELDGRPRAQDERTGHAAKRRWKTIRQDGRKRRELHRKLGWKDD